MASEPIGRTQQIKVRKQGASLIVTIPVETKDILEIIDGEILSVRAFKGKKGKFGAFYKFKETEGEL